MTACASGCTQRGHHLSECQDEKCRGCLPRQVDDPRTICQPCEGSLRHDLLVAPDLVAHLREQIEPGIGEPVEHLGKKAKRPAPPAPLNVAAVAAADDLHATIASWAVTVIEERHVTGPSWVGSVVRPASKHRDDERHVRYIDPAVVGVRDPASTQRVVTWLLAHTAWASEQDWARDMVHEVTTLVRTLRARWPMQERMVWLPVPCPACGCMSLERYAPKWVPADPVSRQESPDHDLGQTWHEERTKENKRVVTWRKRQWVTMKAPIKDGDGPYTIWCAMVDCGQPIQERLYEWHVRLFVEEMQHQAQEGAA